MSERDGDPVGALVGRFRAAVSPLRAFLKELHGAYRIAPTGPTFHSRRPIAPLDRIFVDHALAIEAAGVHASAEARKASDHLPIWARVAL